MTDAEAYTSASPDHLPPKAGVHSRSTILMDLAVAVDGPTNCVQVHDTVA